MKMKLDLERILVLERDLVYVNEELEKSLKWINFSKILINMIDQGNNTRRGMGCEKIYPPYNPHYKSFSDDDCMLFVHCRRDEHIKKYCHVSKKYGGNSSNYSKKWNRLKKGHGPTHGPKL